MQLAGIAHRSVPAGGKTSSRLEEGEAANYIRLIFPLSLEGRAHHWTLRDAADRRARPASVSSSQTGAHERPFRV